MTTKEKVDYIKDILEVKTLKEVSEVLNIDYGYLRRSMSKDYLNMGLINSFLAYCLEKGINIDKKFLVIDKDTKKIDIENKCFKCRHCTIDYTRYEFGELYCNLYNKFLKDEATNKDENCYNWQPDINIYTLI